MIALVTVHDQKYEPLAEWTLHKNKKQYCQRHGYQLHYSGDGGASIAGKPFMAKANPPIPDTHIPIGWGKIYVIRKIMQQHPEVEWIFNTDTDVMITNMDIKIEDIIKEHAGPNIHMLIPADCNGINCGNMLIRNNAVGKAFINTIIAGLPVYRHWYLYENQLIQDMFVGTHLRENGPTPGGSLWASVGRVIPQRVMNSYDYSNLPLLKNRPNYKDILGNDGEWEEGDFLVQWPATSLEYRINVAKETHNRLFGDPDAQ